MTMRIAILFLAAAGALLAQPSGGTITTTPSCQQTFVGSAAVPQPCACRNAPTTFPLANIGQQCYNATVTTTRCAVPEDWAAIGGGATSCSAPGANWLTCAISGGALTLGAATGQTSHKVIGTCGSATSFAPCSLVAGDLPSIPLSTGVTGTLPAANLPAPGG